MDYYFKTHKRLTKEEAIDIFGISSYMHKVCFTAGACRILLEGGFLYFDTSCNHIKGYYTFLSLSMYNDTSLSNLKYITIKHNIKYNKELN